MYALVYPNATIYLLVQIAVFALVMLLWFVSKPSSPAV